MSQPSPNIAVNSLTVLRGGRQVLTEVDATLEHGLLTALVGPNGAGKSTLLRTVCGLETPAAGHVQLGDRGSIHALSAVERARQIAWVPDQADLPFAFTVLETVILGRFPWHQGAPGRTDHDRALAALDRLGLAWVAERPLAALSSGERQKAMIARALAGEAPVLLLDEPCANLDVGAALELLHILRELARAGRAVCLTLHDLALARRFTDRVVCLDHGRVAAAGAPGVALAAGVLDRVFHVKTSLARSEEGEETLLFSRRPTI